MNRLVGWTAISFAEKYGLRLSKYNDPIEMERDGLTVEEAEEIARKDDLLIYLDVDYCEVCLECESDDPGKGTNKVWLNNPFGNDVGRFVWMCDICRSAGHRIEE